MNWDSGDGAEKYFDVPILDDGVWRGDRRFAVDLSGAQGAGLGTPATTTVTLLEDDPLAALARELVVRVEDQLPAGAIGGGAGGEVWNWAASRPSPYSGALAHPSPLSDGWHQHYFYSATETLAVEPGQWLFAYVYLDPANPPREILLQWCDGDGWDHMAYWGADLYQPGVLGPANYQAGPQPVAGRWTRLELSAAAVGLEGHTLNGMSFILRDGQVTWDHVGKASGPLGSGGAATGGVASAGAPSPLQAPRFAASQVTLVLETAMRGNKPISLPLWGQPAAGRVLEVSSNLVDWTVIAEDAGQNPILHLRLTNDPAPALRFFRLAPAARGAGK